MILIIDNYDSFTYNLVHYIEEVGVRTEIIRNDKLSVSETLVRQPSGIVISPGPCTPKEAGISVDLVSQAPETMPVFGVCLGFQAIAAAFGGEIGPAITIMHGKPSTIHHFGGPMFGDIPEEFEAIRYHSLAVRRESLPDCLKIEAQTDDGEIMALSHLSRPVYGVQFHPESIGSSHGRDILRLFLMKTGELNKSGLPAMPS